mmetsp:Transcript_24887/g.71389  ORF Transcript_24887/g.71389 Transcript_24887/m.71389 type:complete len:330 (-) Transcript_24887:913-1902(-)
MNILATAADDEGSPRLAIERGLQQLRQLGVVEGNARRIPAGTDELRTLSERLDATLEREQALVDVVRLCDTLATMVVLLPWHRPHLLFTATDAARRSQIFVGLALADALGASQVDEAERRLHKLLHFGRPLSQAQDNDGVRSRTALVHRRACLALRVLTPAEHILKSGEVVDRHLALTLQDVAVAHAMLRSTVDAEATPEQIAHVVAEHLDVARAKLHLETRRPAAFQGLQNLPRHSRHETVLRPRRIVVYDMRSEHRMGLPAARLPINDQRAIRAIEEIVRQPETALPEDLALGRGLIKDLVELPVPDTDARRHCKHGSLRARSHTEY